MVRNHITAKIIDRFAINLIENPYNEILLLKRHKKAHIGPGLWGFSSGHIEADETAEKCSLREITEEIGEDNFLGKVSEIGPIRDSLYGGIYEIYLFHYKWQRGNISLNHEHTDYVWVSMKDYKNYAVVDGIDEDINYFGIWPVEFLNQEKLPKHK